MSPLGYLISLFPYLHLGLIGLNLIFFLSDISLLAFCLMPLTIYGFPVLAFRIHNIFFPLKTGVFDLSAKYYTPWWGAFNLQQTFNTFPAFERLLLLCPPIYSAWLRLWGAKIGSHVYYTPYTKIADRPLMEIGSHVIFGFNVAMTCHVITPKEERPMLYLNKICIGNRCFIGAYARMGPGSTVADGAFLKMDRLLVMDEKVEARS